MFKKLSFGILVFFLFYLFTNKSLAIEYGGIGGRPAYPRADNPRTESIFIHEINPGETIEEGVYVINNKPEAKTLLVYPSDYIPSTDGGFACKQLADEQTEVGNWIELETNEVTLSSIDRQLVKFTITAPEDAEVGEHNGCIIIQEKVKESDKAGINLSLRTGLRVALTIPGEIVRKLELASFKMEKKSARTFRLVPEVKNEGNVSIDADVKVVTTNALGKVVLEHGGQYPVLRGDTSRWNFEFTPSQLGGRFKSQAIINYNNGEKDIVLTSDELTYFIMPTTKVVLIAFLALLPFILITSYIVATFMRLKKARKTWENYKVKKGETIEEIAKRHNTSWKYLAKVNRIRAPYVIYKDQVIKVRPKK